MTGDFTRPATTQGLAGLHVSGAGVARLRGLRPATAARGDCAGSIGLPGRDRNMPPGKTVERRAPWASARTPVTSATASAPWRIATVTDQQRNEPPLFVTLHGARGSGVRSTGDEPVGPPARRQRAVRAPLESTHAGTIFRFEPAARVRCRRPPL